MTPQQIWTHLLYYYKKGDHDIFNQYAKLYKEQTK